jgi:hypothetical protein
MGKLNPRPHTLRVDEARNSLQFRDMSVFPDAKIGRRDATFWHHGRGFKRHKTGSTLGPAAEVDQMPIIRKAVLG